MYQCAPSAARYPPSPQLQKAAFSDALQTLASSMMLHEPASSTGFRQACDSGPSANYWHATAAWSPEASVQR